MKVLVFGSANIDRTYTVDHFVTAGETASADKMELFCGGKGFNQAVAFARAGSDVYFAGAIGEDGDLLANTLHENGVNIDYLKRIPGPSGHAVIQVTPDGQNSILILAGSNAAITHEDVDTVLAAFSSGDLVVLQNEISSVSYIIDRAKERGMIVALNPSPFNDRIRTYDLSKVDYLLVNEVEGNLLTGFTDPGEIVTDIRSRYPEANVVLTLGCEGSVFAGKDGSCLSCGVYKATAVDTTAAGDTYTGYFLSEAISTGDIRAALKTAAVAGGISVSRKGAAGSIPYRNEVTGVDFENVTEFSADPCKECVI